MCVVSATRRLLLAACVVTVAAAEGQPSWYCGVELGGVLEHATVSVFNPITQSVEVSTIYPLDDNVAVATVSAPRHSNVTVSYAFTTFPVQSEGVEQYHDTVGFMSYKTASYEVGVCVPPASLSTHLPTASVVYQDEGLSDPHTVGVYTVFDEDLELSGFTLSVFFFDSETLPGVCGPPTLHVGGDFTSCIVPNVLLPMTRPQPLGAPEAQPAEETAVVRDRKNYPKTAVDEVENGVATATAVGGVDAPFGPWPTVSFPGEMD